MNDDFLTRLRRPPRPEFAAALYQRISQPVNTQPSWLRWRRPAFALGAGALALALIMAAAPPARAWAAAVLRQIGVIHLVEQASPAAAPDPNAPPPPTSTPIPADRPMVLTTVEQVAAEAGFQPWLPAYLPAGFAQTDLGAMEYLSDAFHSDGMGTFFRYASPDSGGWVEVQQSRFFGDAPREFAIGPAPVVDITVRGVDGVYLAGLPASPDLPGAQVDVLLWWEDGYVFALHTGGLPLAELTRIAESLAAP